jgi:23S rRNA (uracil1939-C5)-methyltransferase
MAVGGRGVARIEGVVIFIDDVAPDEEVEIEIDRIKKNFAEARLIQVLKASPSRVKPRCHVAGICGGCNWQHISYEEQLKQKRELVSDSLRRFAKYEVDESFAVRPSPTEFNYRNRIQIHFDGDKVGFHRRGSHSIVDVENCDIAENSVLEELRRFRGERRDLGTSGRLQLTANSRESAGENVEAGDEDSQFTAFSQVNTRQNKELVEYVTDLVKKAWNGQASLVELYSGGGNFTFPLASSLPKSAKMTTVELNRKSVEDAKARHLRDFADHDIRMECASVDDFVRSERIQNGDFLLLDPPRTGCGTETMRAIAARKPSHIVYVSCHPVTLARDLAVLRENGYRLRSAMAFDMFPQTDHVETVVHAALD